MRILFLTTVMALISESANATDDRWAEGISMRFGVVTAIDEKGRFALANRGEFFQLGDQFDFLKAKELMAWQPLFCESHDSLLRMENGYSIAFAPDCDVLTETGNIPLEDFLD